MPQPPYCAILLLRPSEQETSLYKIAPRYYEAIRDALDRRETGWREFELYEYPSGHCLIRMEDIVEVQECPADWLAAAADLADLQNTEKKARGLLE